MNLKNQFAGSVSAGESKSAEGKSDPAANKPNLFYRFDENDLSQKRLPIHLQIGFIKHLTCEETKNLLQCYIL